MSLLDFDPHGAVDPTDNLTPAESQLLAERIEELVLLGAENMVQPGDAIGLSQTYFDSLDELANRYYRQENFDAAVALYTRLIQLKPRHLGYYKGLGASYLGLERYSSAIKVYTCGQFFGALDAELHYYLGLAHYFNKEVEPAFEWLRFARVLDEQDPSSDQKFAGFATQLLNRLKTLVSPEQARKIDLRPPTDAS